jgi:hypothetical protein
VGLPVAAGPERVVGEEPAAVVAVVSVAGRTSDGAPLAAVVGVAPGMGAAAVSGSPTPAFCPQAAATSTTAAVARARNRLAVTGRPEGLDDGTVMVVGQQFHRVGRR